jgi:uncharacterized membrane protein
MLWFVLTLTAVLLVTTETQLEKKVLVGTGTLEFAALFAFGNALVLLPMIFVADLTQLNLVVLGWIFLSALLSAGTSFLTFKAIKHGELSEVASLLALSPLVVSLLAWLFLSEHLSSQQLLGLGLIVFGIIFLEFTNWKVSTGLFSFGKGKYIFYIILCLVMGGFSAIFDRLVLFRWQINPLVYLIFIQLFIAVNYLVYFIFQPHLISSSQHKLAKSWKIIVFISVLTVIHRYLYSTAIQIAFSMGLVVAVYRLSALFNVLVAGEFFFRKEYF